MNATPPRMIASPPPDAAPRKQEPPEPPASGSSVGEEDPGAALDEPDVADSVRQHIEKDDTGHASPLSA